MGSVAASVAAAPVGSRPVIKLVVVATVAAVVGTRIKRGGWTKDHLRKDAMAIMLTAAFFILVLRVAFKL